MNEPKTINITEEEYYQLIEDSIILNALRNTGVDNWEWYDEAMEDAYTTIEGIEYEQD